MKAEDLLRPLDLYEMADKEARLAEAIKEEESAYHAYVRAQTNKLLLYRELRDASHHKIKQAIAHTRREVRKRPGAVIIMRSDRQHVTWLRPLRDDDCRIVANFEAIVAMPCYLNGQRAWHISGEFYLEVE